MCRLIAVGDDSRDEKELCDLCWDYRDKRYMIVGSYSSDVFYIQYTIG